MPMVPSVPPPSSGLAPLAGVRAPTAEPQAAFGVPHEVDLSGAASGATALFQQEREHADQISALHMDSQLSAAMTRMLYDPTNGVLNRRGKAALAIPEDVETQWKAITDKIGQEATTVPQKLYFERAQQERRYNVDYIVARHMATEVGQYDDQTTTAAVQNERDFATLNYNDPHMVEQSIGKITAAWQSYGQRNGLSNDVIKEQTADSVSQTYRSVIERMLASGNDLEAKAYYDGVKDRLVARDSVPLAASVEEGSARGEAMHRADQLVVAHPDLGSAMAATKDIQDPKVRDYTEQRVESYFRVQAQAQAQQRAQLFQHASDVVEATHDPTHVPPAVWSQLSLEERNALDSRAATLQKGLPTQTDWTKYYDLKSMASATPDAFLQTNLLLSRNNLGDAEFKELTDLQASMRKSEQSAQDKLSGYRTISGIVEDGLRGIGISPTDKGQQGTVAQFHQMVDQQVGALEQQSGKKPSNQDVQQIVDDLLVHVSIPWGKDKRVFQATPDDLKNLTIKDVPMLDRTQITAALHRRGKAATDARILELFTQRLENLTRGR